MTHCRIDPTNRTFASCKPSIIDCHNEGSEDGCRGGRSPTRRQVALVYHGCWIAVRRDVGNCSACTIEHVWAVWRHIVLEVSADCAVLVARAGERV